MTISTLWMAALLIGLEPGPSPAFREVAVEVGLDFVHQNGMAGGLYTPELLGSSVALFDFDGDGDLDVYLGQGGRLGEHPEEDLAYRTEYVEPVTDRLYRNDLDPTAGPESLRFTDVTEEVGLEALGYNMGVAVGDYDRDGRVDVYLTNLGTNQLLRNLGNGRFEDRTREASADDRRWSVPASFFDFDGDGWLDLYVGNYHRFRVSSEKECFLPNGIRDYCGPLAQPPEEDRLLRNRGDGTFQDVTVAAGFGGVSATALGSVAADFNLDGRIDLYVANDLVANHLWLNQGDGRFVEDALLAGAAFDENGRAQASMGVVAADFDGDGAVDLFMSHLLREYNTLYVNDGRGLFTDRTQESGLVEASWPMTGFGTAVLDYDGDGTEDIFVVNGAVHRIEDQLRAGDPHPLRMENQLYRGLGEGRFSEVPAELRQSPRNLDVSRGLAVGDIDNDGDPDLVISNNAGPVRLLRNDRPARPWLGLRLLDETADVDVYGARVTLDGVVPSRWARVHTDGSFAAARDPRILFALEGGEGLDIRVVWPSGDEEIFEGLEPGAYRTLRRGTGRRPGSIGGS